MRQIRGLIVEDNEGLREVIVSSLSSNIPNMTLEQASDAKEAMEKVHADPPQLILMDIQLPGGNGLSLTKRIKEEYPEIVVIIFTSYDLEEYRSAAAAAGASHFIVKGSSALADLEDVIESVLKRI